MCCHVDVSSSCDVCVALGMYHCHVYVCVATWILSFHVHVTQSRGAQRLRVSYASHVFSSVFILIRLFAVAMLVFRPVEKISCVVIMDSCFVYLRTFFKDVLLCLLLMATPLYRCIVMCSERNRVKLFFVGGGSLSETFS